MLALAAALGAAAPGRATTADEATPPATATDVPAVDAPRAHDPDPSGTTTRWTIDDARSQAQFRIRLLGIVPMSGEFLRPRGTIAFDADGGDARVDASLPSAELRMANPAHADWARSAEFFDAARHPEIHFRSRPIPQRVLREGGPIDGELTLRGVTRAVGLKVERGGCDPARARECEIEVYGQVRRSDFGMAARRATVGDWVSLRLRIVAVASDDAPP
jgi:polyisoprenoid-binding protein YceI